MNARQGALNLDVEAGEDRKPHGGSPGTDKDPRGTTRRVGVNALDRAMTGQGVGNRSRLCHSALAGCEPGKAL